MHQIEHPKKGSHTLKKHIYLINSSTLCLSSNSLSTLTEERSLCADGFGFSISIFVTEYCPGECEIGRDLGLD